MITQIKSEHRIYQAGCSNITPQQNLLSRLFTRLNNWLAEREVRRRDRKAIKFLMQSTEAELRDIGITRDAVNWASKLPSEQSATMELQMISRAQSRHARHQVSKNVKQGEE